MRRLGPLLGAATLLAAFAVWWVVTARGLIGPFLLPSPIEVLRAAVRLDAGYLGASLSAHLSASLSVVLGGFAAAALVGVPLGVLMAWSPRAEALVGPLVALIRPIPPPAWIPLAILWFGIGMTGKVFVVFVAAVTPCLINAHAGIRQVPTHLLDAGRMLGAGPAALLFRVAVPCALPTIFTGLRIGLGNAWATVVAAELVVATAGFGYVIMNGYRNFEAAVMAVGIVAVAVVGFVLNHLFRFAERHIVTWGDHD